MLAQFHVQITCVHEGILKEYYDKCFPIDARVKCLTNTMSCPN